MEPLGKDAMQFLDAFLLELECENLDPGQSRKESQTVGKNQELDIDLIINQANLIEFDQVANSPLLIDNMATNKYNMTIELPHKSYYKTLLNELQNEYTCLYLSSKMITILGMHLVNSFYTSEDYQKWKRNMFIMIKAMYYYTKNPELTFIHNNNLKELVSFTAPNDTNQLSTDKVVEWHAIQSLSGSYSSILQANTSEYILKANNIDQKIVMEAQEYINYEDYSLLKHDKFKDVRVDVTLFALDHNGKPLKVINFRMFLCAIFNCLKNAFLEFSHVKFMYIVENDDISLKLLDPSMILFSHPIITQIVSLFNQQKDASIPKNFIYKCDSKPIIIRSENIMITDQFLNNLAALSTNFILVPKKFNQFGNNLFSISFGHVFRHGNLGTPYTMQPSDLPGAELIWCPVLSSLGKVYFAVGRKVLSSDERENMVANSRKSNIKKIGMVKEFMLSRPNEIFQANAVINSNQFKSGALCTCLKILSTSIDKSISKTNSQQLYSSNGTQNQINFFAHKDAHILSMQSINGRMAPRIPKLEGGIFSGCGISHSFSITVYTYRQQLLNIKPAELRDVSCTDTIQIIFISGVLVDYFIQNCIASTIAIVENALLGTIGQKDEMVIIDKLRQLGVYAVPVQETVFSDLSHNERLQAISNFQCWLVYLLKQGRINTTICSDDLSYQTLCTSVYRECLAIHLPSDKMNDNYFRQPTKSRSSYKSWDTCSQTFRDNTEECIRRAMLSRKPEIGNGCSTLDTMQFIDACRSNQLNSTKLYAAVNLLCSTRIGHKCLSSTLFRKPWHCGSSMVACQYCKIRYSYGLQADTCKKGCDLYSQSRRK